MQMCVKLPTSWFLIWILLIQVVERHALTIKYGGVKVYICLVHDGFIQQNP